MISAIISYTIIGIISNYISRIERRINIGVTSVYLSAPYAIMSAIGTAILAVVAFKFFLLAIALILLLLSKLKYILGAKAIGAIAASLLGFVIGPIGWGLLAIFFILFIGSAAREYFEKTYNWFLRILLFLILLTRRMSDTARSQIHGSLQFLVLFFEVPVVCGSSIYGIWQLMDIFDGHENLTGALIVARVAALLPFTFVTYRTYIRDTTPPKNGGDGLDIPMPLQITDIPIPN